MLTGPDTASIPSRHSGVSRPRSMLRIALSWLTRQCDRYGRRRELAELDPRLLKDIGVTRYDAGRDADVPLWRCGR